MAQFKVTIEVLVEAEGVAHAEDVTSEALTRNLRDTPGWKDWRFSPMHNGETQAFPGPVEISKEDAAKEFPFTMKLGG